MTTFSVGSFAASGTNSCYGQSFTPNVPGPNGVGSPGAATSVSLASVSIGYPSSSTTGRATTAYIYTSIPSSSDLSTGTGSLATSDVATTDGSGMFGSSTYSRTFTFTGVPLDPTVTYFVLFPSTQSVRLKTGNPYSGGGLVNTALAVTNNDAQFDVQMSYT